MRALLILLLPALAASAQNPAKRPNIVFLFADDHAYQAIGAYGSKVNETPHLDRLARQGVLFRNCCVTNSICAPSRAVVLTGKHSHLNGIRDNGQLFDGAQTTFPKLLRKAGYQTAMIGKWHLKTDPTGFDHWEVLPGQGQYYNPDFDTPAGRVRHPGYCTDIITDRAIEWLDEGRDGDKPFLLMCQHKAPHRNWLPSPKHLDLYDDVTIPEPETLFDDYSGRCSAAADQEMTIERHLKMAYDLLVWPPAEDDAVDQGWWKGTWNRLDAAQRVQWEQAFGAENAAFRAAGLRGRDLVRWKYQRYVKNYLRCIASLDENVGRLMRWLDDSGLAENTLVVYSSDQGWYLGDHGWYDKRWMYEESLKTPLIVRWPGRTSAGTENRDLVSNLDFAQTLLEAAGVPAPAAMQGRSLVPLLRGATPSDWRTSVYYHYYEFPGVHAVARHCGVRTDRYKLIHFYQLDAWELFDLETDPRELHSVHADPAYADRRQALEAELLRLQDLYGDDTVPRPR